MYQGKSINAEFQAAMEELFNKYGVDIYFSGHVHSYERDYPVRLSFFHHFFVSSLDDFDCVGVSRCFRSKRIQ